MGGWDWGRSYCTQEPFGSPPILLVSPQGNNIMLVASQPALQGPERKSYEVVFREVRGTRPHRV